MVSAPQFIQNHEEFVHLVKRVYGGASVDQILEQHQLVIVGGQALAFWFAALRLQNSASTLNYLFSDDLDFAGNNGAVSFCEERLGIRFKRPSEVEGGMQQATINLGAARIARVGEGESIIVDVLSHVPGISDADLARGIDVISVDGVEFAIINPLLCLKARVSNFYAVYKPDKVKELGRIQLCVQMIRKYLAGDLGADGWSKQVSKDIQVLAEMSLSEQGRNLAVEHGVDFMEAVPADHPQLHAEFLERQLPRLNAQIQAERERQAAHNARFGYKNPLLR